VCVCVCVCVTVYSAKGLKPKKKGNLLNSTTHCPREQKQSHINTTKNCGVSKNYCITVDKSMEFVFSSWRVHGEHKKIFQRTF